MKKIPEYLGDAGRAWVQKVTKQYSFSRDELEGVYQAACCLDRIEQARLEILKTGITVLDRYDVPKQNPAVTIERDARTLFFKACRDLKIIGTSENEGKK